MLVYSPVFIALMGLMIAVLGLNVSRLRMTRKIAFGDGNDKTLMKAIRAHGNAVEHLVLISVLMVAYELQGGSGDWLIGAGSAAVGSRVMLTLGIMGIVSYQWKFRTIGAAVTYFIEVALGVLILWKAWL